MGRVEDRDLKEPTKSEVDASLLSAKIRNPDLKINPDSDKMFSTDAVHLAFGASLTSFSRHKDYHFWNFGSWDTKPTAADLIKMATYLKEQADAAWGEKPIRAFINGKCPFVNEFKDSGMLITELIDAMEVVQPGTTITYARPVDLAIPLRKDGIEIGQVNIEEVYAHTLPMDFIETEDKGAPVALSGYQLQTIRLQNILSRQVYGPLKRALHVCLLALQWIFRRNK